MNLNNQASFTMQILPRNTFFKKRLDQHTFFSFSGSPILFVAVIIVEEGCWSGIAYINRYFTLYTKP